LALRTNTSIETTRQRFESFQSMNIDCGIMIARENFCFLLSVIAFSRLAQSVEQLPVKQLVVGSSPTPGAMTLCKVINKYNFIF
jgi:hypothetical protein